MRKILTGAKLLLMSIYFPIGTKTRNGIRNRIWNGMKHGTKYEMKYGLE